MRILITGGCGFLGSHLVEHFLKAHLDDGDGETEIVVVDKLSDACGFDRLRDVTASSGQSREAMHARVRTLGGVDLGRAIAAGVRHEIGRVDYIIHAAADCSGSVESVLSNARAMSNVLEMANGMPDLRRVFVMSTDAVYGPIDEGGHGEGTPYKPSSIYGASMASVECVVRAYSRAVRSTIVTAPNLIGERQGADAFLPMVIRMVRAGERVSLRAGSSRQYMHCRTFAHALEHLLEGDWYFAKRDPPADLGLPIKIHVSGQEMSAMEFAQRIAGALYRPLLWDAVPMIGDYRRALQDRIISEFEWHRPSDQQVEQQLDRTVNWYVNNPRWLESSRK